MKWLGRAVITAVAVVLYLQVWAAVYPAHGLDFACYYIAAETVISH